MYITNLKSQLNETGFVIEDQVELFHEPIDLLAQQSKFLLRRYSFTRIIVVVAEFPQIDWDTLLKFSKACHQYAVNSRKFPWFQHIPFHFARLIPEREILALPIAVVDEVDSHIVQAVRKTNPINYFLWREISIPLLIDLKHNELHYCTAIPAISVGLHQYGVDFIEANLKPDYVTHRSNFAAKTNEAV